MAGYQVAEAGNLDDAIRQLEQQPVSAVVAGLDLPPNGTSALLSAMHGRSEWKNIPVLALTDSTERMQAPEVRRAGFQDCQPKFDSVAMLESLDRLASTLASSANEPAPVGEKR
jgi:CheY-like chemotaxis protein